MPIQQSVRVAGTAVTALNRPDDDLVIHAAVEACQAGDVLVVSSTAPSTHGMLGDLREAGFLVWSRRVSCQGTVKSNWESVNVPALTGGACITVLWVGPCSD